MIDPQACAERILENEPALAEPLFDLLLWANRPNLGDDNDYDEILNLAYSKLDHCRAQRDLYAKTRRVA